jgi:hypothetical protein
MYMIDIEMGRPELTELPLFELDDITLVAPGNA